MKKKREFLKENKDIAIEFATGACIAAVSIVTYSYVCKHMGYRMSAPWYYDEKERYIYAKSITGTTLRSKMLD